jgi:hypothetical protein
MSDYQDAVIKLHQFMHRNLWTGVALIGPDQGVRFNRRLGRYIKSLFSFLPWADNAYYLWTDQVYADLAENCTRGILKAQQPAGYWEYPHSGWEGRIATVEGVWASLGLLESYGRTKEEAFLHGAMKYYDFLVKQTGFQEFGEGLAINYFANKNSGIVPNNTTLALPFFAKLAQATMDDQYLKNCPQMISFLATVQLETGEFPYARRSSGEWRTHYQCYQYNAFELQDLAIYYQLTRDVSVLPLIQRTTDFLLGSVIEDGSTRFDCGNHDVHIVYNTAAIGAALELSRHLGLCDSLEVENRVYRYVLAQQNPSGSFPFSTREYGVLMDRRCYPRPTSMILYHLLLKALDTDSLVVRH